MFYLLIPSCANIIIMIEKKKMSDFLKNRSLSLDVKVIHRQRKGYIIALKLCIFMLNSFHIFILGSATSTG